VGVLGNGAGAQVLPLVEICFDALPVGAAPVYGYEAKWIWDTPERPLRIFECPALVETRLGDAVASTARAAYLALGCRDWARIDVRLDTHGLPHVLEVNPLPGVLPDPAQNSCLPKAARVAGIDYDDLILRVLDVALARYGMSR
jgi:D-alanine-D-alanine ligase